jgi:hypothetical protein
LRTIKDAIVHAFHDATIWELRRHITGWQAAYNFARQLKALRRPTPIEAIHVVWQQKPEPFHQPPGLYAARPNS